MRNLQKTDTLPLLPSPAQSMYMQSLQDSLEILVQAALAFAPSHDGIVLRLLQLPYSVIFSYATTHSTFTVNPPLLKLTVSASPQCTLLGCYRLRDWPSEYTVSLYMGSASCILMTDAVLDRALSPGLLGLTLEASPPLVMYACNVTSASLQAFFGRQHDTVCYGQFCTLAHRSCTETSGLNEDGEGNLQSAKVVERMRAVPLCAIAHAPACIAGSAPERRRRCAAAACCACASAKAGSSLRLPPAAAPRRSPARRAPAQSCSRTACTLCAAARARPSPRSHPKPVQQSPLQSTHRASSPQSGRL